MKAVAVAEFKAKCLRLMDRVNKSHEEIVITKHGKPVAKLVAVSNKATPRKALLGYMQGTAKELGDIMAPLGEVWDADK